MNAPSGGFYKLEAQNERVPEMTQIFWDVVLLLLKVQMVHLSYS